MVKDIVYFDLETRRTAEDVGGWSQMAKMGVSIAVTYSTARGEYRIYQEKEIDQLIDQLMRADLVIGYNHIHFDYQVLMGHTIMHLPDQLHSLDILVEIESKAGYRPKLDSVAAATLGKTKSAEGLQAIRWWQQGKLMEIAEYCCYDVKVTKCIHEFGVQNGFIKYKDRTGKEQTVEVNWAD
jgi:hypothetical protein